MDQLEEWHGESHTLLHDTFNLSTAGTDQEQLDSPVEHRRAHQVLASWYQESESRELPEINDNLVPHLRFVHWPLENLAEKVLEEWGLRIS